MVRLFVRHSVADYPAWRRAYDAFDPERAPMGVRGQAVFQSVDDPSDVTVWHDFDSLEQGQAFAASDRLREVMQQAGVTGEPQVWFTTEA